MVEQKHRLELVVDGVPYIVHVTPFSFNDDTRFKISYNGSPEVVFTWNNELKRYTSIGEDAATFPDSFENAINEKLITGKY